MDPESRQTKTLTSELQDLHELLGKLVQHAESIQTRIGTPLAEEGSAMPSRQGEDNLPPMDIIQDRIVQVEQMQRTARTLSQKLSSIERALSKL